MASLTIRDLDGPTKERLRVLAARNGRSMEEEARTILRTAVSAAPQEASDLVDALQRRFRPFGGVTLRLPSREPTREPPKLA
jgi:antitoxin FitA